MIITLCGYMGAGKTSVARHIAKLTKYEYIDLDIRIEEAEGMSTRQIFRQSGEGYFRQLEREHLEVLSNINNNVIISLGGGSVVDCDNRREILKSSTLVYIEVPFDVCYSRVAKSDRPIIASKSIDELKVHYKSRLACYKESHYTVDGTKSIVKVAEDIIALLKL